MLPLDQAAPVLAASDMGGYVGLAAVIIGPLIAIVAIVMGTIKKIELTKAREQSRREIAAYIAEGSMTPEDGRRLMAAGRSAGESDDEDGDEEAAAQRKPARAANA